MNHVQACCTLRARLETMVLALHAAIHSDEAEEEGGASMKPAFKFRVEYGVCLDLGSSTSTSTCRQLYLAESL